MAYRGITELRSAKEEIELVDWQIDIIKKCRDNPEYFIFNYVYTLTKENEMKLMESRPRQLAEISVLQSERFIKADWYRQSGFTTIVLAYFLWKAIFTPNLIMTYCARKRAYAQEMFDIHIRKAIQCLPYWLQPGVKTWTEHTVTFKNGSAITARPAERLSIGGYASDYLFIDEFGWLTDNKMLELTQTELVCAKNSAKRHVIIGNAQIFGAQSEANTLYWKNCDIPFHYSLNLWKANTDEEKAFEKEMRLRLGDRNFEKEYVGITPGNGTNEREPVLFAREIDGLPDPLRNTRWRAICYSNKADWDLLNNPLAVTSVIPRAVSFNEKCYPGLILRCMDMEGTPVSAMDLSGFVIVDVEYYDFQFGKCVGKVRYRCLSLSSMVESDALSYTSASGASILYTDVKLIVLQRGNADGDADLSIDFEKCLSYDGAADRRSAISKWLEDNVVL